jgi:hypothetical protein
MLLIFRSNCWDGYSACAIFTRPRCPALSAGRRLLGKSKSSILSAFPQGKERILSTLRKTLLPHTSADVAVQGKAFLLKCGELSESGRYTPQPYRSACSNVRCISSRRISVKTDPPTARAPGSLMSGVR